MHLAHVVGPQDLAVRVRVGKETRLIDLHRSQHVGKSLAQSQNVPKNARPCQNLSISNTV